MKKNVFAAFATVALLTTPVAVSLAQAQTPPVLATPAVAPAAPATRLDAIMAKGTVRVGTTGDYKPFSYMNPETKQFEGLDIDMAQSLGQALGV